MNDESRQQGKDEIREHANGAIQVAQAYKLVRADAMSRDGVVPVPSNRPALKDGDEEENNSGDNNEERGAVDDVGMGRSANDAKKKPSERQLGREHTQPKEYVAKKPKLEEKGSAWVKVFFEHALFVTYSFCDVVVFRG